MFDAVVVEPSQTADSAVIWLHGLGASGHDFEPVLPLLELDSQTTRFIFPHAPEIPVTVNGGISMPAWYDIEHMDMIGQSMFRNLSLSRSSGCDCSNANG